MAGCLVEVQTGIRVIWARLCDCPSGISYEIGLEQVSHALSTLLASVLRDVVLFQFLTDVLSLIWVGAVGILNALDALQRATFADRRGGLLETPVRP